MPLNMIIEQALNHGYRLLDTRHDTDSSANIDTQTLLCHVLDCERAKLFAWPEQPLSDSQQQQFLQLLEQRQQGKPVAYLTGHREFWSLTFRVTPDTLIPRPETELLVETILERFSPQQTVTLADLGTGSGAIACAIASERPDWPITATDISAAALTIARQNAAHHQLNNIHFLAGNWFEALPESHFNIIVSNPPYIASHDKHLDEGDVRFEPATALRGGEDGMDAIRYLCRGAGQYLKAGGLLIFEHGFDQQQPVLDCLQKNHYKNIFQLKDLGGHCRISGGQVDDAIVFQHSSIPPVT